MRKLTPRKACTVVQRALVCLRSSPCNTNSFSVKPRFSRIGYANSTSSNSMMDIAECSFVSVPLNPKHQVLFKLPQSPPRQDRHHGQKQQGQLPIPGFGIFMVQKRLANQL